MVPGWGGVTSYLAVTQRNRIKRDLGTWRQRLNLHNRNCLTLSHTHFLLATIEKNGLGTVGRNSSGNGGYVHPPCFNGLIPRVSAAWNRFACCASIASRYACLLVWVVMVLSVNA